MIVFKRIELKRMVTMPNRINAEALQMDHRTSAAVCDGIGERLREIMKPAANELPPRLQELMERLRQVDDIDAPSIVPSLDTALGAH
ncbi:hypothetical protein ASC80_08155 [Afipia sp. Root123D2]|uniref:hypothetical protein n=1 Tax=Afipia sp. Root123D2 TaxID=1736436 RepID=UPI0006FEE598|nr:hypothetical protein [Afipia sp. Root123D2]KQW23244.1 hypothetical protein ASC80_08155 [Afipia sp. Root123D2]